MTAFDPLRAAREELAGFNDIVTTLKQRGRECEEAMSKAERELNAVRKLLGFAQAWVEQKRAQIEELERNA